MKRVVITGYSTLNSLGNNTNEYWTRLLKGDSGITKVTKFDTSDYTTQIAGEVKDFDPTQFVDKKEARRTSSFILYAIAASMEAVKHSGIDIEKECNQIGVEIGSGIGGIQMLEEMALILKEKGPSKVSPFTVPMMIPDMASGMVAIKLGAKGPNACTVTACA